MFNIRYKALNWHAHSSGFIRTNSASYKHVHVQFLPRMNYRNRHEKLYLRIIPLRVMLELSICIDIVLLNSCLTQYMYTTIRNVENLTIVSIRHFVVTK